MAKKNTFITLIEYIPAMVILFLLRLLPYKVGLRFCALIGRVAFGAVKSARDTALNGLRTAFPDWDEEKLYKTARKSFEHMCMGFGELALMPKLSNDDVFNIARTHGYEHVEEALAQGKGMVALAAHIGGWEFVLASGAVRGYKTHALVRSLDNKLLDRAVEKYREDKGAIMVPRSGISLRKVYKAIKTNHPVAFLIDQNWVSKDRIFVDFFGKPAATAPGAISLALKTGAPVVCSYDLRRDDLSHDVYIEKFEIEMKESEEETLRYNTAKFTKFFENVIRENPEQWLWAHARWRSVPSEEEKKRWNIS